MNKRKSIASCRLGGILYKSSAGIKPPSFQFDEEDQKIFIESLSDLHSLGKVKISYVTINQIDKIVNKAAILNPKIMKHHSVYPSYHTAIAIEENTCQMLSILQSMKKILEWVLIFA